MTAIWPTAEADTAALAALSAHEAAAEAAYAPQWPGLVAPYSPLDPGTGQAMAANFAYLCRVIVPRSGTLRDLSIFMRVASGNIDVGVYDVAADPRALLFSTGAIASPAANVWTVVGDPALAVTAGQQLDFAVGADNATAQVANKLGIAAGQVELPAGFWPTPGQTRTRLGARATSGAFPLPASISYAAAPAIHSVVCIIARVE